MDGVGYQLLAGAALTLDQHGGARRFGDDLDQVLHLLNRRAVAVQAAVGKAFALLFLETGHLQFQTVRLQRFGDHQFQFVQFERLEQIIIGAGFQRLHRRPGVGQRGDHDHQQIRSLFTDFGQHLQTADARQFDVQKHKIGQSFFQMVERLFAGIGGAHAVPLFFHHFSYGLTQVLIVFHNQNIRFHSLTSSVGKRNLNAVPRSGMLVTVISPPWAVMMR
ncbi:MAG: hypothetical protein BWY83_01329 [bacterium ADurb.Bin478]|nr:MAG: hypothetical protein BWY83_01329 [bacterium ADurb.Bin478]